MFFCVLNKVIKFFHLVTSSLLTFYHSLGGQAIKPK
nr:MAG TPA: hypothetical protein [Caudoviricetes sp.]